MQAHPVPTNLYVRDANAVRCDLLFCRAARPHTHSVTATAVPRQSIQSSELLLLNHDFVHIGRQVLSRTCNNMHTHTYTYTHVQRHPCHSLSSFTVHQPYKKPQPTRCDCLCAPPLQPPHMACHAPATAFLYWTTVPESAPSSTAFRPHQSHESLPHRGRWTHRRRRRRRC